METRVPAPTLPLTDPTSVQPPSEPDNDTQVPTLLSLASLVVSTVVDLEEIAFHLEYLPCSVRQTLLRHMQDKRLRRLERLLSRSCKSNFSLATLEVEFQAEWRRRCHAQGLHIDTAVSLDTLFREPLGAHARDARRVFWEYGFRNVLRAESAGVATVVTASGDFVDGSAQPELALYEDVVVALKVNARELVPRNVTWMLQLRLLRRVELHHPTDHHRELIALGLESLLTYAPSLQELGLFHGRLSTSLLQRIAAAIAKRQSLIVSMETDLLPLRCIELISVKLKGKQDHREIVNFFAKASVPLESVRISSVVADFENRRLIDSLLALPHLSHLSLEHNDLEDDAFTGLLNATRAAQQAKPTALRHLRLGSNAISSTTIQVLSNATLEGVLTLKRLEIRNNQQVGDAGIHSLAPMLAPGISVLTHLDVRNCHFGLEGALTLLSALGENDTMRSLDMSQNFFGSSIGDLLADFLLTNQTLQRLHINYVGLGLAGCTERLLLALRTNQILRVLSVGANRLRDQGATRVMEAVAERSRTIPYEALDLSGNLITVDGLHELGRLLENRSSEQDNDTRPSKRQRLQSVDSDLHHEPPIGELGLLNNDLQGGGDATRLALAGLQQFIGKIYSNEWSSRRNAYDDEV